MINVDAGTAIDDRYTLAAVSVHTEGTVHKLVNTELPDASTINHYVDERSRRQINAIDKYIEPTAISR